MGECVPCLLGVALAPDGDVERSFAVGTSVGYGRFGDFELLDEGRAGGMGRVYRVRQTSLNRVVALKIIRAGAPASPRAIQRFRAETETVAQLDHPRIVPIYDVGEHDGCPYFTMRWIEGGSLADALPRRGRAGAPNDHNPALSGSVIPGSGGDGVFGARRCAELIAEVARAIHHAHQRGIIHRDLKPSNILLDEQGQPHVSDFGLAKRVGQERGVDSPDLTASGDILGTPAYMAPEQAEGNAKGVTTAADVYALGAILYELMCGRPPFEEETPFQTMRRVVDSPPKRPSAVLRSVDRNLETICLHCLEKDPRRRYASAAALADDLERFLDREPLLVRPPSPWTRTILWARRKPAIAALTALFVVTVLGAAAFILNLLEQRGAALAKSESARTAAEASAAETRAVLDFFEARVLAAARPKGQAGGLGYNVTLRSAIQAAEASIERSFSNQPLAEASVRGTIGLTYRYLGEFTNAIGQYQQAWSLRKRHLGETNAETLRTMNNLAVAYLRAGVADKALELNAGVLNLRRTALGENHPETLSSLNNLANATHDVHGPKTALPLYQEALEQRRAQLGADNPETLTSMNNLAAALKELGEFGKAIELYEVALPALRKNPGPDHPNTLSTMNNLARAYQAAGRLDAAILLFQDTLTLTRAKLGPAHPDTVGSLSNLALCYQAARRTNDAFARYGEIAQLARGGLTPDRPDLLAAMENVVRAYMGAGRFHDAESILDQVLSAQRVGRPINGRGIAATLDLLGNCLLKQNKLGPAVDALRECVSLGERGQPDDWTTFKAKARLGIVLLEQGEYLAAEPLLIQGFEGMEMRNDKMPRSSRNRYLREVADSLVRLYSAQEKPAEAAEWRKRSAALASP